VIGGSKVSTDKNEVYTSDGAMFTRKKRATRASLITKQVSESSSRLLVDRITSANRHHLQGATNQATIKRYEVAKG
jgi:hypothetical protein